ncbi:MAG: J domain-containing protein, partial [Desulfobacterales bacterium]|nr:J domain-containing protein [Desulfobacterales bacterium]
MYLAALPEKQWFRFVIRESYWDRNCYRSRDLVDLGCDPTEHIVYPGGRAYYVDPELEDLILDQGGTFDADELEDLFWPFVDEDVRYAVGSFRRRRQPPERKIDRDKRLAVHLFDKRRIHFLRFGQMDQGYIGRVPAKIFRPIRNRSRDEIEQYFFQAERILKPYERKAYVYVIFDLQRYFTELCAKTMPQGL